jgi:hypothetical protein
MLLCLKYASLGKDDCSFVTSHLGTSHSREEDLFCTAETTSCVASMVPFLAFEWQLKKSAFKYTQFT